MPCSRDCILVEPVHISAETSVEEAFLAFLSNKHNVEAVFTTEHLAYFREELSKILIKLDYYETVNQMQQLKMNDQNDNFENRTESSSRPSSSLLLDEEIHIPSSRSTENGRSSRICLNELEPVHHTMQENLSRAMSQEEFPDLPEDDERIVFNHFVSQSNRFLSLKRIPEKCDLLEDVNAPLGVCFDEVSKQWIIADTKNSRILLYPSCQTIGTKRIGDPTAVCVLSPGVTFAILTFSHVAVFHYKTNKFSIILDEPGLSCRGIAVTPNRNLVTIRKFADSIFLSLFSSQEQNKQLGLFPLEGNNASFLHMMGNTILITDLGNQSVTKIYLSDANEKNIQFRFEAKHDGYKWNGETEEPSGKFCFVSGVQIDGQGWSLIGDAGGHTIQLFDEELNPMYRVSADFALPYMSAFAVNNSGEMMICGRHSKHLYLARLCALPNILPRRENPNFNPMRRGGARGAARGGRRGGRDNRGQSRW